MTYSDLLRRYGDSPREIRTVPVTDRRPVWFRVYASRGSVCISSGKDHPDSSSICPDRRLKPDEFAFMLDLYLRRKKGEPVSGEAARSVNQSYWYGIFHDMDL